MEVLLLIVRGRERARVLQVLISGKNEREHASKVRKGMTLWRD